MHAPYTRFTPRPSSRAIALALALIFPFLCGEGVLAQQAPRTTANAAVSNIRMDREARELLPQSIRQTGKLKVVGFPHPPDLLVGEDGKTLTGLDVSLGKALGTVLGVEIEIAAATSPANTLIGIDSGRYDIMLTTQLDTVERQRKYDFVDWQVNNEAYVHLAHLKVDALDDLCGLTVGVPAGSASERSAEKVSARCITKSKKAIAIRGFENSSALLIGLQSRRIDVMGTGLNSALYLMKANNGSGRFRLYDAKAQITSIGRAGSVVRKGSGLAPAIHRAMLVLDQSGQLKTIVAEWTDPAILLSPPQINAAKE